MMARTRPRSEVSVGVPLSEVIVASAARRTASDPQPSSTPDNGWQDRLWYYYDRVGEFRAAVNWVGNVLSRARLYATYDDGTGPKRVPEGSPADQVLDEFGNGTEGQRQMLHDYGVLYSVSGEAWTVGVENNGKQTWAAYAPGEVTRTADAYQVDNKNLSTDAVVIRSWRAHPRKRGQADSPARAALPVLAEIHALTQHIAAQTTSRLAGAGILLLPNEIAATAVGAAAGAPSQATAEAFVAKLQEVMSRAVRDRDDPAALVPIVVTGDGAFLDKARLMEFWSSLDEHAIELRTEAIRRLALSLDMPPEILTGTGDVNHWGAWQIDESAIKSHTEPLLSTICRDLAVGYLIPALEGVVDDPENYGIEADTSEMRMRPNRSQEALELWDRGLLSQEALLRETGFKAEDLPPRVEFIDWVLRKMAAGSTTPEIVVEAARMLGVDLPDAALDAPATEARPTPSLEDHPTVGPPEGAALLAASEQMVFRALERAGNRLRNKARTAPDGVSASEMYLFMPTDAGDVNFAMEDSFSHIDRFAGSLNVNPKALERVLDNYCRTLMALKKPYDRDLLATHLRDLL